MGKVRTDEDFKMAVRAQPVIPALADRLALGSRAGEADRHAHPVWQGSFQRLKERGHARRHPIERSEEHTSELQSLMRTSYAVFCLKKKNNHSTITLTRS